MQIIYRKGGAKVDSQTLYGLLYLEINLMATVLIWIIRHKTAGLTKMVAQRNFSMAITAEAVFFLSDTAAVMMSTGLIPFNRIAFMAAKEIYFFSTALMCFFWFVYFEHLQGSPFVQSRRAVRISSGLVWVMGILLILNLFTGILFYTDDDGAYHRGPLFAIQYLLSYTYVFITCLRAFIGLFNKEKKAQRKMLLMLALFPVAPAGAGILQFVWPQLPLACMALSIATLLLYLNWMDEMVSIDPLTRLNNRKQFAFHYEHMQKSGDTDSMYLFLIDANKFKSINDTYGHIQGDQALIRISEALRSACRRLQKRANIARFGGDEFVILASVDNPEDLEKKIHKSLEDMNRRNPVPYELTVSIGVTPVLPDMDMADAIAKADAQMYMNKHRQ